MAVELKQLWAGGTEGNKTTIKARVDLGNVDTIDNNLKVYTVQYKWPTSPGKLRIWVNNELIDEVDATGVFPYMQNLLIGGDGENLGGYLPELLLIKTGDASIPDTDIIAYNKWLADKWLPTGTNLNGYTVQATHGTEPTFSTGTGQFVAKWIHLDESTIVDDGAGYVNSWNDKANFSGVNKTSVYDNYATTNKLPLETGKNGKEVVKFNRDNSFKMSVQIAGENDTNDPDYITFFFVAKFDDFDLTGGIENAQSILGTITNTGTYNTAVRFKKYTTDNFLGIRNQIGGAFRSSEIPRDKILDITVIEGAESAALKILYSKDETFSTGVTTSSTITITDTNKGAVLYPVNGLDEDSTYYIKAELDGVVQSDTAKFKTLPVLAPKGFSFISGSCNNTNSNHIIWDAMREKNPDMFIHMGDLHYNNIATPDTDLFRNAFNGTVEQSKQKLFWSNQSNYYMWDDHDYGANNSDKDSPSRANALEFYLNNIPVRNIVEDPETNGISQYWIVGRCLFILTDCRSNRDDWTIDSSDPDKTLLGSYTKQWFKDLLLFYKSNEDLDVCFWMNPLGWSGDINDPYSWTYQVGTEAWDIYTVERKELANFMYYNNITNVVIVNGDSHQLAIDDGRNCFYATTPSGSFVKASNVPKHLQHLIIESSPFDRDPDRQGGPFQIDDEPDSGGVYPSGNNSFSMITVNDLGSNWIEVIVNQYGYYSFHSGGTELYDVREYRKIYQARKMYNSIPPPNKFKTNYQTDKGTITVPNTTPEIGNLITITYPSLVDFNNMWKANVTGVYSGSWNVNLRARLVRRTDVDDVIVTSPINEINGTFSLEPDGNYTGIIIIQVRNTNTNTTVAEYINDGNVQDKYENLEIRRFIVTDTPSDSGQAINAPTDDNWIINYHQTGEKVIYRLINTDTDEIMAESTLPSELPRSYEVNQTEEPILAIKSYLYDTAASLIAAVGIYDSEFSDKLVIGILQTQFPNGAFPFSVTYNSPSYETQEANFRTGTVSWVIYALTFYLKYRPYSELNSDIIDSINLAFSYLETLMDNDIGLATGGSGIYIDDIFDEEYQIPWISTEYNIDLYFTYKLAGEVLASEVYTNKSENIKDLILEELWDSANNKFYQRIINPSENTKDTADSLNCNSWGAIFLFNINEDIKANFLLQRLEDYYLINDTGVNGYKPYNENFGYPDATDIVWFEGSFGVALAYWRAENTVKYNEIMNNLKSAEESNGSYKYATGINEAYGITDYPSVVSTSWKIIARSLKNIFWN